MKRILLVVGVLFLTGCSSSNTNNPVTQGMIQAADKVCAAKGGTYEIYADNQYVSCGLRCGTYQEAFEFSCKNGLHALAYTGRTWRNGGWD